MMRFFLQVFPLLLATLVVATEGFAVPLRPTSAQVESCQRVAARLPREHLLRAPLNDTISARAWTNYLSSLDFDRLYFTAEDIEGFRVMELRLDDALKSGDTEFAFAAYDLFLDRVSNRVDYVASLLEKGFDLAREEEYRWQRRDGPWPDGAEDWDTLWRKKIKNEYIRILIARENLADREAREAAAATNEIVSVSVTNITISVTNAIVVGTNTTVMGSNTVVQASTNAPGDETVEDDFVLDEDAGRTPEEIIINRYRQTLTVLHDSDAEWVLQKFLTSFTQAYDPHSGYLPPSALADFEIEMKLSLVGIGALLRAEDGTAKIVRLIPGGPAEGDTREQRLRPGDKIIGVGQGKEGEIVDILHWPLHRVVKLIRGETNTIVRLRVVPHDDKTGVTTKIVDLVRNTVKLEAQAATSNVRDITVGPDNEARRIGVIKLPAFYANLRVSSPDAPGFRSASYDVRQHLKELEAENIDGLVLDLRNNGGGSLVEALRLAGLFVRRGPMVQVKERFGVRALPDDDPGVAYEGPMVVLVNRLSASASEIVAGALQDYGRAVIVGDSKTHGKGTVQTVVDFGRDASLGAMKVTTASYYRISGASTQLRGIAPDIVVPTAWDFMETGEEHLENPIPWSRVRPAYYSPVADLSPVLPELRTRSQSRRDASEDYQIYMRLLERIGEMNESEALPLTMAARRKLAETEREMADLRDRLESESMLPADQQQAATDLVLNEAVSIVSDLADMSDRVQGASEPIADGARRSIQSVVDRMLNAL